MASRDRDQDRDRTERPVPVAIIGLGCLFPKAGDAPRFWANVRDGVDAIGEVPPTHWRPEDYYDPDPKAPDRTYARRGGFLSPVDFAPLDFGLSPNTLEATDATQLLGLVAARQAMDDAGYGAGRDFDRSRVSVLLGVTGTLELVIPLAARLGHPLWRKALEGAGVSKEVADEVVRRIGEGYVGWQEDSFPGLLGNVVAGRISNRLDLGGTNCVVDAACASSLGAVHLAILELSAGRSDMVLTGGMDTFNDIFMYMCFSKTPALSPTGDARPFAAGGDGTILGEGLGCLVLKRLDDAERDGDKIYAVIRSVGSSSDGKGHAIYAPSSEGQTRALREAYRLADVSPDTIELVEGHGTGTSAGDAAEAAALAEVYGATGREGSWCALGSVKSQIGHTKAAAGAAGLIKAALALYQKVLPPTIKVDRPIETLSPGRSPFYLNTEARPWLPAGDHPRRAAVSAFGFGGSNYHCVLEEYGADKAAIDWDGDVEIVALSAESAGGIDAALAAWPAGLPWDGLRREASRSRAGFDPSAGHRLVLVVERADWDADKLVAKARAALGRGPGASSGGITYGAGPAVGGLALLFPGQGAQYPGMFRELACRFPEMQRALAEADRAFADGRGGDGPRLSDLVYPHPAFSAEAKSADEEALRATEVAQPALGAVALGVVGLLKHFGVRPGAVAGHSYGELPSLCAAGRFDAETLHRLSGLRGRSMAEGSGDRGAMLAVLAPGDAIEAVLGEDGLSLVVANKNAPRQSVLSGASAEIARAREAFRRREIEAVALSVSAAFHSPFVADARRRFSAALEGVDLAAGVIPVFANTTGRAYPDDPRAARDLLAGQLAEPVEFVSLVENMHKAGFRTFLEVGPGSRLTGLVGAILKGRPHAAFSVDAGPGPRSRGGLVDLARALAQLAAGGHDVDLVQWDPPADAPAGLPEVSAKRPTLTVPISGANYVKPKAPAAPGPAPTAPRRADGPASHGTGNGNGLATNGRALAPVAKAVSMAPAPAPSLSLSAPAATAGLAALQDLAEQTARLHRQFLEGQDRALQVFQTLLEGRPAVASPAPPPRVLPPAPPVVSAPVVATRVAPLPLPPAPPAATPAPVKAPPVASRAESVLLAVVSEKTGYPSEMLDPSMEIEADLGIDSIKRVEIFGALAERLPEAPAIKAEHLGTLRTLKQVADFLGGGSAPTKEAGTRPTESVNGTHPTPAPVSVAVESISRSVVEVVPLDARGTAPLAEGGAIWVVDDGAGLAKAVASRLVAAGFRPRVVATGDLPSTEVAGLIVLAPGRPGGDAPLVEALRWLQAAGPGLRALPGRSAFLTVTRLDGAFGFGPAGAEFDPTAGGLAGLAKTAGREWPEVRCRALDVDPALSTDEAAGAIVDELRRAGPGEVGVSPGGRVTLELRRSPLDSRGGPIPIGPGDVAVVTGGARGVTAEVAVALARAASPTLVLFGRSPAAEAEPDWLAPLGSEAEIKRALLGRLGAGATPREAEAEARRIVANREALRTLARIAEAGGRAVYRQVDVRDAGQVASALDEIAHEFGPVRALVHGAGVLADARIEAKTAEAFDRVYGTKVVGLRNLLAALPGDGLRALVLFSSTTARLGRVGQVDYAMANEVLNKTAQVEARRRPGCRVVSVNWGPWDGGMVTPSLKALFAAEGVGLIPVEAGANALVRELAEGPGGPVEVVVLGGGGLPTVPLAVVFERDLTIDAAPVLRSHVIDGRAVLPLAVTLEWLAHGALHGNPGLAFHGVDGLRVLRGVFVGADRPTPVRVVAGKATRRDGLFVVPTELRGGPIGAEVVHARADVVLAATLPQAGPASGEPGIVGGGRGVEGLYEDVLFHGPALRGIARVQGCSDRGIAVEVASAPPPGDWFAAPIRGAWLADPLVIDSAFQAMIVWSVSRRGAGSLPVYLARYRQYRRSFPKDGLRVVARLTKETPGLATADIEILDAAGGLVATISGYECAVDASLGAAFRRNRPGA